MCSCYLLEPAQCKPSRVDDNKEHIPVFVLQARAFIYWDQKIMKSIYNIEHIAVRDMLWENGDEELAKRLPYLLPGSSSH